MKKREIGGKQFIVSLYTCFVITILAFTKVNAVEADNVISFKLPEFKGEIVDSMAVTFIKSNHNIGNIGEPAIPWFHAAFLVPDDADFTNVSVSIMGSERSIVKLNNKLDIVKSPKFIGSNKPVIEENRFQVPVTGIFPESDAEIIGFSDLYGHRILRIRIPLAKYDSINNSIIPFNNGTLQITLDTNKKVLLKKCPASVLKRLSKIVLNFPEGELESRLKKRADEKYVIFTTNTIKSNLTNLDALIESKKSKGYLVGVVTDWGTTSSDLRSWLSSRYINENIAYALLIGNGTPLTGDVPMHREWEQNLGDYIPTDFYYAQLSSSFSANDCDAEISVGRIPMYNNNYSTTDAIIERIVDYENTAPADISWRKNVLFAGVYLDNQTSGSGIFEVIRNSILNPNGWDCYRIYADGVGYPDEIGCSYTKFPNAWNSGTYGLVEWSTHGQKDDADKILYSSATSSLSSENPPIVFSASCQNAWIEVSNNLAYSLLKNAAISVVAPTRNSMYLPGQNAEIANLGTNQGYTIEIARGIVRDSMGVANALNAAKSWSTIQKTQLWTNYCDFNVYGCPELGVYSHGSTVPVEKVSNNVLGNKIKYINNKVEFSTNESKRVVIEIYNSMGKKIISKSIGSNIGINRIDVGNRLSSGSYFGRVIIDNKKNNFTIVKL